MSDLASRISTARDFVAERCPGLEPEVGIIFGTGLSSLSAEVQDAVAIPYSDIPGFVTSTVESHAGELVVGRLEGRVIVAMRGRFHAYEGYTQEEITFPVRVMNALGAQRLFVSNACGGLNPQWAVGDIMLIEDHINMMGLNPLVGSNDEGLGPRFPDMSAPYCSELLALAREVAIEARLPVQKGVYVSVLGPCLETRAEYRMLRSFGADVVGMSTVPEVIAAVHSGMKVLGLSVITDACLPDALQPATIEEIVAVAESAEPKLDEIVRGVLRGLS